MTSIIPEKNLCFVRDQMDFEKSLKCYLPRGVLQRLSEHFESEVDFLRLTDYAKKLFEKKEFYAELKRYGTPEKFAKELREFVNFPGAHTFANSNNFINKPIIYQNTTNNIQCYNKLDMFVFLESILFKTVAGGGEERNTNDFHKCVHFYLQMNVAPWGFVDISHTSFSSIAVDLCEILKNSKKLLTGKGCQIKEAARRFVALFPNLEQGYAELLQPCFGNTNPVELAVTIYVIEGLDKMIKANPALFFPEARPPKVNYLRLFKDGSKKFVMSDELNKLMGVKYESSKLLDTIDSNEVMKIAGAKNVVFLIHDIKRSKYTAQPVPKPDNGHCKLAADFLFELLSDLLFGYKIFQKLGKDKWDDMEWFFNQLGDLFDSNKTSIYFIDVKEYEDVIDWVEDCFSEFDDVEVEEIGDYPSGFTKEDLTRELKKLKLDEVFPSIFDYSNRVYDFLALADFFTAGRQNLDNSDFSQAIENSVLLAFFEKMPQLKKFIEQQNASHRLLQFPSGPQRFKDTKWKSIPFADVFVKQMDSDKRYWTGDYLVCTNGQKLYRSDSVGWLLMKQFSEMDENIGELLKNTVPCKPKESTTVNVDRRFMLNESEIKDLATCVAQETKHTPTRVDTALKHLESVDLFLEKIKTKTIYLRTFSDTVINREDKRLLFKPTVFEVIPALLKLQGSVVDKEKIEWYKKYWDEIGAPNVVLFNLEQLATILEFFDINKELITLIPDVEYAARASEMMFYSGNPIFHCFGGAMLTTMAQFHIFQSLICEIDWISEKDSAEKKWLRSNSLEFFAKYPRDTRVTKLSHIEDRLSYVKSLPCYKTIRKSKVLTPIIKLFDCNFLDTVSLSFFFDQCKEFQLPYKTPKGVTKQQLDEAELPAWKARLIFLHAWNDIFFGDEYPEIKKVIQMGIYHRTPILHWESEDDFLPLLFGKTTEHGNLALMMGTQNLKNLEPIKTHDWLTNTTWKNRTYIKRNPKWHHMEEIEKSNDRSYLDLFEHERAETDLYVQFEYGLGHEERLRNAEKSEEIFSRMINAPEFQEKEKPVESKNFMSWDLSQLIALGKLEAVDGNKKEIKIMLTEKSKQPAPVPKSVTAKPKAPPKKPVTLKTHNQEQQQSEKEKDREIAELKKQLAASQQHVLALKEREKKRQEDAITRAAVESANCKKCYRTSQRCETLKVDLKKAEDSSGKWEAEYRKVCVQLEEQRTPLEEQMAELSLEKTRFQEECGDTKGRIDDLESTLKATEQSLEVAKANLLAENAEKDAIIRLLRERIPKKVLANIDHRIPADMRAELLKLQAKQDKFVEDPVGAASQQVQDFKSYTDDVSLKEQADLLLLKFRIEFEDHKIAVVKGIEKIQKTPFLTLSEVDKVSECPTLPKEFLEDLERARNERNALIEGNCMICFCPMLEEEAMFRCTACLKDMHLKCLETWWKIKHACPHCKAGWTD